MKNNKRLLKKLLLLSLTLTFISCTEIPEAENNKASLSFETANVKMTEALTNVTSVNLSVDLKGSSSDLCFKSYNTDIVSVEKVSPDTVCLTAQGEGKTKISAYTKDNKLVSYCSVEVTLGTIACSELTDFALVKCNVDSAEVSWKAPLSAGCVKVLATESGEGGDTVTSYFKAGDLKGIVEGLEPGTNYSFKACAVNNPETSKEYASSFTESLTGKTLEDFTAPSSVTVKSFVSDHSIKFTWKEPSDSDYEGLEITALNPVYTYDGDSIEKVECEKGKRTYTFKKLSASTEYSFIFATKDKYGNIQGDSNNLGTALTVNASTSADITSPSNVKNLIFSISPTSVKLEWKESSSEDACKLVIEENSNPIAELDQSSSSAEITLDSGSHELSIYVKDYDSNKSSAFTASLSVGQGIQALSDVKASSHFSNAIIADWSALESTEENFAYSIKIENTEEDADEVYNLISLSNNFVYKGLTEGTSYKVSVYPGFTYPDYTVRYIPSDESSFPTVKVLKILRDIRFNWGSRVLVPLITKDESKVYNNVVTCQHDSSQTYDLSKMKYSHWIVHPSLSNELSKEYYSLEAADEEGNASGLYLTFEASTSGYSCNFDIDSTGYGNASDPHGFALELSKIADFKNASFKTGNTDTSISQLSDFSAWLHILSESGKEVHSINSNPYLVNSIPTGKENELWCYKDTIIGQ